MRRCADAPMRRRVRELRGSLTEAERLLWSRLRRRQVGGFKFRRQHQIGLYICDFVSRDSRIVVELDGSQHAEQLAYGERRDNFLRFAGFRVLRFWNSDVYAHIENVVRDDFRSDASAGNGRASLTLPPP